MGLSLPITGIVDRFRSNVELSAQSFDHRLRPFDLRVSRGNGSAVGYNTDANSLAAAMPGWAGYYGPLSLPFFGCLYSAVPAAAAVAQTEMEVDILGAGQASQRCQLLDIAGFRTAAVNFDTVPTVAGLSSSREKCFFNGVKLIVAREAKRTCRRGILPKSH